jgi:hypothetical protein
MGFSIPLRQSSRTHSHPQVIFLVFDGVFFTWGSPSKIPSILPGITVMDCDIGMGVPLRHGQDETKMV